MGIVFGGLVAATIANAALVVASSRAESLDAAPPVVSFEVTHGPGQAVTLTGTDRAALNSLLRREQGCMFVIPEGQGKPVVQTLDYGTCAPWISALGQSQAAVIAGTFSDQEARAGYRPTLLPKGFAVTNTVTAPDGVGDAQFVVRLGNQLTDGTYVLSGLQHTDVTRIISEFNRLGAEVAVYQSAGAIATIRSDRTVKVSLLLTAIGAVLGMTWLRIAATGRLPTLTLKRISGATRSRLLLEEGAAALLQVGLGYVAGACAVVAIVSWGIHTEDDITGAHLVLGLAVGLVGLLIVVLGSVTVPALFASKTTMTSRAR